MMDTATDMLGQRGVELTDVMGRQYLFCNQYHAPISGWNSKLSYVQDPYYGRLFLQELKSPVSLGLLLRELYVYTRPYSSYHLRQKDDWTVLKELTDMLGSGELQVWLLRDSLAENVSFPVSTNQPMAGSTSNSGSLPIKPKRSKPQTDPLESSDSSAKASVYEPENSRDDMSDKKSSPTNNPEALSDNEEDAFDVTKVTVKDIPSYKSGKFNEWFDSRTPEEIQYLYSSDKRIRRKIENGLRADGGMHEFLMVSRAPKWKEWGVTAEQVHVDYAVETEKLKWTIPLESEHPLKGEPGGHRIVDDLTGEVSAPGSTTYHLELNQVIDDSSSLEQFDERLDVLNDRWQVRVIE